MAGFIRNHPDLAEDANNALEDDSLYALSIEDAITEYNERVPTPRPRVSASPWQALDRTITLFINGEMPNAYFENTA